MPRRGKRVRLAKGVFRDESGIAIILKIHGEQKEYRFKPNTPLHELVELRRQYVKDAPKIQRGTLKDDIKTVLATVPKGRRRDDFSNELNAWQSFFQHNRHGITSTQIQEQIATWQNQGRAPSTINHRRQALLTLYKTLDGPRAPNPVRDVQRIPERVEEPRGIDYSIIERIIEALPDRGRPVKGVKGWPTISQTKARLRVMAYTGLPQSQLMRVEPRDVDFKAKTIYVRPRRKGAGVPGRTLPLTPQAVDAFKALDKAKAWGPFSTRCMAYSFTRALDKAKTTWQDETEAPWPAPDDLRAYDFRHSFLTLAYRVTKDLRATAELGLHADLRTTARYALAAVTDTAKAASDLLGASFPEPSESVNRLKKADKSGKRKK